MKRTQTLPFWLVMFLLLSACPLQPGQSHRRTRPDKAVGSGFGKPQVIRGTISTALPERNLVVLRVYDPRVTVQALAGVHRTVKEEGRAVSQSDEVSNAVQTPGEAEYDFKVNGSTSIRIDGQAATLADLTSLAKRRARVRFVPYRTGNVALRIDISG
jgi:hypothetical protein